MQYESWEDVRYLHFEYTARGADIINCLRAYMVSLRQYIRNIIYYTRSRQKGVCAWCVRAFYIRTLIECAVASTFRVDQVNESPKNRSAACMTNKRRAYTRIYINHDTHIRDGAYMHAQGHSLVLENY